MEHLDKTSRWTIWMHLSDVQTNRAKVDDFLNDSDYVPGPVQFM